MIDKFLGWFTPPRRKFIYHTTFAVLLILAMYGVITAEELEEYMRSLMLFLAGVTPELAAAHVNESDAVE